MVLPNSSASVSDGSVDDFPQNDNDQFNSNGESTSYMSGASIVSNSSLPKPCPGMGLLGFTNQNLSKLVDVRIQQASKVMGRPPTEEEATSLAYWTSKQIAIISYGTPIGVGAGLYRAYQTAPEFRFPFIKPNLEGKFNPDAFITSKMQIFSGQRSRMAWHVLRTAAYGAGGNFVGTLLFASYAMSVVAVGELSDKRLVDYVAAMKKVAEKANGKLRERPAASVPMEGKAPVGQMTRGAETAAPPARAQEMDDASPTSGAFWDGNDDNTAPVKVQSDSIRRSNGARQPQPQPEADAFDDMSPTGGASVLEEGPSGESAWDRLRRQNAADVAGAAAAASQRSSKYGDRND